jgi:hypothetical protein
MQSSRATLEQIADPENLREAFLLASKGKGSRSEVVLFRGDLTAQLGALRREVLDQCVQVGNFNAFTIFEPKERRIHAPCFRERVLHHALLRVCEKDFERWAVFDSYACRKGKGREAALHRAETFAARSEGFLKVDVSKYFDSISHEILLADLKRRFRDSRVVSLWERIVKAYTKQPGIGLPIGALTSQHLANHYLSAADRFIKETLRVESYVRYMDDMALWGTRTQLREARRALDCFLREKLRLTLKKSWHLQPVRQGMDFLGYRVFPNGSQLNRASRRRFTRRWAWCERQLEVGSLSEAKAQLYVLAMTAFVRVAGFERVLHRYFGATAIGHESRQSGWQLEQRAFELPLCQPQQERAGQPQQQRRFPSFPQLMPNGLEGLPD